MGASASKYFRFKNENTPRSNANLKGKKQNCTTDNCRNSTEIKNDVLRQLKNGCIGRATHIGKGGVAFYTPLKDLDDLEINIGDTPPAKPSTTSLKRPTDVLHDTFTAKEREIMAEVLKADNLLERGRGARVSEERRLLALRRREKNDDELKHRYAIKMREAEQRRHAVQERLRPKQYKVNPLYSN